MTVTVEQVLGAATWADLGLPWDASGLRSASRAVHPDVCADPRATDAFTRLQDLYSAPEFTVRVASGSRAGRGRIRWTLRAGFDDLAEAATRANRDLSATSLPQFFTTIEAVGTPADPGHVVRYADADDQRWWFLAAFGTLDSRTAVWVAKRLAAAIAVSAGAGWIHGDLHPGTVLLMPAEHGLKVDGWWSAVPVGEKLTLMPTGQTPPRYLAGAEADARLMVGQAAAVLLAVSEPDQELREVFARHAVNPGEPQQFFDQVEAAAKALYGPPSWHPLAEPASEPI